MCQYYYTTKRFVSEVLDHVSKHSKSIRLELDRWRNERQSTVAEPPRLVVQVEGLGVAIVIKNDMLAAAVNIVNNAWIIGFVVGPVNLNTVARDGAGRCGHGVMG